MQSELVQVYSRERHGEAGLDSGPQNRQHGAVPLGSQELERRPDVLRGLRPPADWGATATQDPQVHKAGRCSEAVGEDCRRRGGERLVRSGPTTAGKARHPPIAARNEAQS